MKDMLTIDHRLYSFAGNGLNPSVSLSLASSPSSGALGSTGKFVS